MIAESSLHRMLVGKLISLKREGRLLFKNIGQSIIYSCKRSKQSPFTTKKIVFTCMGNICRSAFAEYLMKSEAEKNFLPVESIESCGLNAGTGASSPAEAIETAKKFGLDLENHLSRNWEFSGLEKADLIFAMEYWQYKKLVEYFPQKRGSIRLLREFDDFPRNLLCNIDDPFGQNLEVFERCFRQIERAIKNLNSTILSGYHGSRKNSR